MIFETHAHYNDDAFDADREELLASLPESGINTVVNVCAEKNSLSATKELTENYSFVYGAYGIHPDNVGELNEELLEQIRQLCRSEKAVAVGEIGLDYYWDTESHETQAYWFRRQLELAREEKLPVIIHSREAAADTLQIAEESRLGEIGGILHCFSYSKEMAEKYLDMGMYLGIGGVVTFNNAKKLKAVVEAAPLEQLVLETDCPYLAPVPYRGKRNSSLYLPYVVQAIAEIKGVEEEEVIRITRGNALRCFGLNE
ncbi:MAG: TatD family hydrolase [Lachnospiraceae bacterium]|nr:TatD family hydrolase [Lachnospiraceae bacterium]